MERFGSPTRRKRKKKERGGEGGREGKEGRGRGRRAAEYLPVCSLWYSHTGALSPLAQPD